MTCYKKQIMRCCATFFVLIASAVASAQATQNSDLVNYVVGQNEDSHKAYFNIGYHFELNYERFIPKHAITTKSGEVDIVYPRRRIIYSYRGKQDGHPDGMFKMRAVINEEQFAFWIEGNPTAYQYEHDSLSSIGDREWHFFISEMDNDYLAGNVFGDQSLTLRQIVAQSEKVVCNKDKVDGKDVFILSAYKKSSDTDPRYLLTISPQDNYLITKTKYFLNGKLHEEKSVELDKNNDLNLLFPRTIQITDYYINQDAPSSVLYSYKIEFSGIRKSSVPGEKLDIGALDLPEHTAVNDISSGGDGTPMIWRDGNLVPQFAHAEQPVVPIRSQQSTQNSKPISENSPIIAQTVADSSPSKSRVVAAISAIAAILFLAAGFYLLQSNRKVGNK